MRAHACVCVCVCDCECMRAHACVGACDFNSRHPHRVSHYMLSSWTICLQDNLHIAIFNHRLLLHLLQ